MLKITTPNEDIILKTNVLSEDHTSDRDFYNRKLLNFTTNSVINGIVNSEIYEYKPELTNEVNFNIFFLRYIQSNDYDEIKNYVESDFQKQYNNTKIKFGLIDENGGELSTSFNSIFETRQPNGLRETDLLFEKNFTDLQRIDNKPYYVADVIGESALKKPSESGIPIFYNSFTLPYWDLKDKWLNEELLYTNKPYFYNSFLFLEFFDSPSNITQNRIQSIPIFINSRYTITEKNITKKFNYERPSFKLTEGVEGYSFFFIKNYITNEFYVRYSFWDALNGKKISLLPSSNLNLDKKWLQDSDNFNQKNLYLKYVLDYDSKTYKIYEYNTVTNEYDTERSDFDLYQLEFDSYYKNTVVTNEKPIDSSSQITQPDLLTNPLTFTIKNLYTNNYIGDSTGKYTQYTQSEIDNANTFLNASSSLISVFNTYIGNINTEMFGELPEKEMVLPVVDRKISGYQILLKSFLFKNTDTITWNIRNIEFKDVYLLLDGKNISNTIYNQRQSLWNEKPSSRLSEAITLLNNVDDSYDFSYNTLNFTKDVVYTYLSDANVFRALLQLIERERYDIIFNRRPSNRVPVSFLDLCFNFLNVRYKSSHFKSYQYLGFGYNLSNDTIDQKHTEIYPYIGQLVENYIKLKSTDINKFNQIRNLAMGVLQNYRTQGDITNVCGKIINYIKSILSPKDNQELVDKYISLTTKKNLTLSDGNIIENTLNKNSISLLLDTPINEIGYEPRDYTFETFSIQNGDKSIIPGETNKVSVYFNIGEKVKFMVSNANEITINGNLRVSIINTSGDIKNIIIPLKSAIKKRNLTNNQPKNIPQYKLTEAEPGSNINQLTILK
jgi:hypothetical protein